jgi:putative peptide zinc metalloprotease protein
MEEKYPKLRDDLIISRQEQGGQTVFFIKDPLTDRYFRLREPEYFLAGLLDGKTGREGMLAAFEAKFGLKIKPEQLEGFISGLKAKFFLESSLSEYTLSHRKKERAGRSLIDRLLYVKLKAFDPQRFLEWLYSRFRFTLSMPFIFFASIIIIAGLLQAYALAGEIPINIYHIFGLSSVPVIIIAVFLVVALHELAHSIVCRHFGGKVSEMGFLLLYFQVCFYCNLSDSYLFEKKREKILTILAGIYFQAFLGGLTLLLWRILKTGTVFSDILFITAAISLVTLLFNLNPLLKLDGYYLLTDLVEIPNLRGKAFGYLKRRLKAVFLAPDENHIKPTAREKRIYLTYSLLALLYSIVLFYFLGSILYRLLVGKWGGGGFLLFLAIVGVIFSEPIRKTIKSTGRLFTGQGVSMPKSKRFYIWNAILLILIVLAIVIPVDLKINAPLTVNPLESFVIKGGSSGQLETKWFRGGAFQKPVSRVYQFSISDFAVLDIKSSLAIGARVDSGQVLLQISSDHFTSQLEQTRAEIEKAEAEYKLLLSDPKTAELARAKAALEEARLTQINVENEYQRARKMHDKNLISDEEMEIFETSRYVQNKKVDIVQSEYDLLREGPKAEELLKQDAEIKRLTLIAESFERQIDDCIIRAPFGGVLTTFGLESEIISLARSDSVEAAIRVPEEQIDILATGQRVKCRVAGYPQVSFEGEIITVIANAQAQDNKLHFRAISVIPNKDGLLKGGMTGYGKIYCGKTSVAGNLARKFVRFFRVEFWSWW